MPLADYTEANSWLDGTKIKFVSNTDALPESQNADRVIKSVLAPLFPDYYTLWDSDGTPEAVPALVTEIAARLMASYRYAKVYSEETESASGYAERLKADAMVLLMGIADGTYLLYEIAGTEEVGFVQADFYPNDSTTVTDEEDLDAQWAVGDPLRAFSMTERF